MCFVRNNEGLTIVTEYMSNGSLYDVLSDKAVPLSLKVKLSILSDVAAGMAYLHGSNPQIIHCDLKSSNVLAKVCDFGLTVIAHQHGELIQNGVFSTKSDVYAFGVMMWEIVTRDLPYKDMNPVLVAAHVVDNLRPDVGSRFESVQPLRELMVGACMEPHNMFIVTEWMDMGNLYQLLSSGPRLDKQHGIAVLASTCSALTYLHLCNIVHGDLKSSNILLNKKMDVKLSDFGLTAVKTANKTSTLCGTIAWMAPEVLSSAVYSEASDVYSFGIVMHEVLTCEVPFRGLNKVAAARDILDGKRPQIPSKLGAYGGNYVELMCRCWHQQPSERPAFKKIGEMLSVM
eukprot:m51a1_g14282 putative serine threonine kinase (344) ;mRNA; r:379728-382359